ncbi:MAG TPA: MFS transporter [Nocardioides sp.]|uniref:MFS transporter n=1 Tax=Nocardioides sp. TaxID=35761 RepID=UPI002E2F2CF5|nr:MFS transporter [Nocardioides sp.]HEX3929835.1 MFS transporter [Nocardioides sp.]
MSSAGTIEYSSTVGRGVVLAAVLGSGMAMLDGTVVNVALKTIGKDLGASLAQLQWITNGYLLLLASLILLGGALGDRLGRRRVFLVGVVWFAVASVLCGLAPDPTLLIAARVLQGIGGALLTPGSLAIIEAVFARADRGRAIGAWSGLGSIAAAIGPFLGGGLVEYASWRWIFLINAPLAAVTVVVALRYVPETRAESDGPFDALGAALAAVFLGGLTYWLIEWRTTYALLALVVGVVAGVAFLVVEHRSAHPMMPLSMFSSRNFSAANAMTLLVYAALGAILFFLVIDLQTVLGYGALKAGLATLPLTVVMLLLAARGGQLGARIGPRIPMTLGPLVMAAGVLWLSRVDAGTSYWTGVLPPVVVFGLGLSLMVAPLTMTVLAAAPEDRTGIASGVNNAVARAGSLLAVAALPVAVGLSGDEYADPGVFDDAYGKAMVICAVLLALGGVVSWLTITHGPVSSAPTSAN